MKGQSEDLYPPKIQEWLDANQDDNYTGVGIEKIDGNESFAIRQATTKARSALAMNIEINVAAVAKNFETSEYAKGTEVTKQTAAQTLSGARTVGPVKANGQVYVLQYINRDDFRKRLSDEVKKEIEISEAELDELLKGL
jgi:hypothetical protein